MTPIIEPHHPAWKDTFERLKSVLSNALAEYAIDIQHVGSTAIPNLVAKPILDIDIIITQKTLLEPITQTLEKIGYISKGDQGIPGRFAFRQRSGWTPETLHPEKWQEHHLYVCYSDSLALKNHLVFRDALLHDEHLATSYAALKRSLANEPGMTREKYTQEKTAFILSALAKLGLVQEELNDITLANKPSAT